VQVVVKKGVVPKIKSKWNDVLICYNIGDSITTFQWYKETTTISNATKQYYVTNKLQGSYSVMTTDKNGCINISDPVTISSSKSLSVYPNPATTSFILNLNSEALGKAFITLYNSSGEKIIERQAEKSDGKLQCEISSASLQDGIYTLEVMVNEEELSYSRVIIINR
jgi:hypothetical protein